MATALATKGTGNMEKKTVSISSKRQITIPLKFYNMLGFGTEAECEIVEGGIILKPVCKGIGDDFSADILEELLSEGYVGEELLAKFKERQKGIRRAVVNMIEESEKVANGEGEYYTLDDVFDSEG